MLRLFAGFVFVAALAAPILATQGAGAKDEEAKKLQAEDVDLLAQAFTLEETAKKLKVPEAYVAAGRLMLRMQKQTEGKLGKVDAKFSVQDENGKAIADAKVEDAKLVSFGRMAEGYFQDALAMAADQNSVGAIRDLINGVKKDPGGVSERGALGGPKMIARVIGPGQQHTWAFAFDTNFVGAVGFQASAPCHCRMVNDAGHRYFDQTVSTGKYTWHPRQTVAYRAVMVTIRNPQSVPVTYRLFTN